jgi:TonB family protein
VVLLSFSLDRNGHVLAHHIARSSGYADLDNEVMDMIMRAEPLPAFPANMPQAQLEMSAAAREECCEPGLPASPGGQSAPSHTFVERDAL